MVKALDFYLIEEEDEEIRQVLFQLYIHRFEETLFERKKDVTIEGYGRDKYQGRIRSRKEVEYEENIIEVNLSNYTFYRRFEGEKMNCQFVHLF